MTQSAASVDVISCPLDDCEWNHAEPVVDVPANALANIFGPGVMTSVAQVQCAQRIEDALQKHFGGHRADEYLRTITSLRRTLIEAFELLDTAIDEEHCQLDHNGNCQAHSWFPFDQGRTECYQARIKRFVDEGQAATG